MKLILFLLLTAGTILHAQQGTTPDPNSVSWGMETKAVVVIYPDAQIVGQTLKVGDVEIESMPFAVSMVFMGKEGGLSEIRWDCVAPEVTDTQAGRIMDFFRQKYGAPTKENREAFMELIWEGPGQRIKLIWSPESDYSPPVLRLLYQDPSQVAKGT